MSGWSPGRDLCWCWPPTNQRAPAGATASSASAGWPREGDGGWNGSKMGGWLKNCPWKTAFPIADTESALYFNIGSLFLSVSCKSLQGHMGDNSWSVWCLEWNEIHEHNYCFQKNYRNIHLSKMDIKKTIYNTGVWWESRFQMFLSAIRDSTSKAF